MIKKLYITIFLLFLVSNSYGAGTCWNGGSAGTTPFSVLDGVGGSPSCEKVDVEYCVETVAAAGETVLVPNGSCEWSAAIVMDKGVNLIGGNGGTTTIKNTRGDAFALLALVPANAAISQVLRVSGFTWDANGKTLLHIGNAADAAIDSRFRIDHNVFINTSVTDRKGQAIINWGNLYGVVDSNTFDGIDYPIANSSTVAVDTYWDSATLGVFALGNVDTVYYEDNSFINMEGFNGAGDNIIMDGEFEVKYVFRYNDVQNTVASFSLLETHGEQGAMGAGFGFELYGNDITMTNNSTLTFWRQRSGLSRIFLNNATTTGSPTLNAYTGGIDVCPSTYVANKVTHESYWWGSRKNLSGTIWSSTATQGLDGCNGLNNIPTAGRDVFFDASVPGVTSGPLGAIPGVCTEDAGYWATDQNTSNLTGMVGVNPASPISGAFYICGNANNWVLNYTPYIYPHPLRQEGEIAVTDSGIDEDDVVAGGDTITMDITGDYWCEVATCGYDMCDNNAATTAALALLTSTSGFPNGFVAEVQSLMDHTDCTLVNSSRVQWGLPAAVGYEIDSPEHVTAGACDTCTVGQVQIDGDVDVVIASTNIAALVTTSAGGGSVTTSPGGGSVVTSP